MLVLRNGEFSPILYLIISQIITSLSIATNAFQVTLGFQGEGGDEVSKQFLKKRV